VEAVHLDQVREHGGLPGVRDERLLEAALARPYHKWAYDRDADLTTLAASYAFGIVQDHPFYDANKRVAFLTSVMFLGLNGRAFDASEAEVVTAVVGLAGGTVSENAFTDWLRSRIRAPRRR
jgi:death-on-curing protein